MILDSTCGGKTIWFKKSSNIPIIFMDQREVKKGSYIFKPKFEIKPDVIASFTKIPFKDNKFNLVIFDPPFIKRDLKNDSWITMKYGQLFSKNWEEQIELGLKECWRVLKNNGVLIFKWSEIQIKIKQIQHLFPSDPLFGSNCGKQNNTLWLVFYKYENP